MTDLERFTAAYIEAMYWADCSPDSDIPGDAELAEQSRLDIEADCRSFWRRFGCYVLADVCRERWDDPAAQAGHDFYFTRNGHGVGFWEPGDWPDAYAGMLDTGATGYGELTPCLGDDGLVYVA